MTLLISQLREQSAHSVMGEHGLSQISLNLNKRQKGQNEMQFYLLLCFLLLSFFSFAWSLLKLTGSHRVAGTPSVFIQKYSYIYLYTYICIHMCVCTRTYLFLSWSCCCSRTRVSNSPLFWGERSSLRTMDIAPEIFVCTLKFFVPKVVPSYHHYLWHVNICNSLIPPCPAKNPMEWCFRAWSSSLS